MVILCFGFTIHSVEMSSSSLPCDVSGAPFEARLMSLEQRILDREFVVYFGNNNQLVIKESLIDTWGLSLLSMEKASSQNEEGLEIVEKLPEMRWTEEEIRATPSTWGLQDFANNLMEKYMDDGEVELRMSNIAFELCNTVKRICTINTEEYFMFQGDTIVKL